MRTINVLFLIFITFLSCSSKKEIKNESSNVIIASKGKAKYQEISICQEGSDYNELSSIAEMIELVKLDENSCILNTSMIIDVTLSENYIFLLTMYEIFRYDKRTEK